MAEKVPVKHEIVVAVVAGKIEVTPCCAHVNPGDVIVWRSDGHRPVAVVIERFEGPLGWHHDTAPVHAMSITGTVRLDAEPGFYPYAVIMSEGTTLLVKDPEIIVRPPDGRG